MELVVKTGREEKQIAEQNKNYHKGVPAITVVVDGGWSKRSHKHSYNANSSVDVIFGAATKSYYIAIGVRNLKDNRFVTYTQSSLLKYILFTYTCNIKSVIGSNADSD